MLNGKINVFYPKHLRREIKQKTPVNGIWRKKHENYTTNTFISWMH